MKQILFIDDDTEMLQSLIRAVSPMVAPFSICGAGNSVMALQLMAEEQPSVVVLDLCINELIGIESGFKLLSELRVIDESCRILVLTGHGSIDVGIRALTLGAASFVEKPVEPSHLAALIRDSISQAHLRREFKKLARRYSVASRSTLQGESAAVQKLRNQIDFAASTNQSVLLLGETGTGKSLCARLIHDLSSRRASRFVHYQPNFGGGDLIQSELFGHTKGAFTGATDSRKGLVSEANGGTLFLDELDEIPAVTQVRLLDLMQEMRIRPVGADAYQSVDCRAIAATNRPLREILAHGKLRRDLYHRIAHCTIEIPPLRERLADLPFLVRDILNDLNDRENLNVFAFGSEFISQLSNYGWPGNIRELQAYVAGAAYRARFAGMTEIVRQECGPGGDHATNSTRTSGAFHARVEGYKLQIVQEMLSRCEGNQVQAARELSLDRGTMRRILSRGVAT